MVPGSDGGKISMSIDCVEWGWTEEYSHESRAPLTMGSWLVLTSLPPRSFMKVLFPEPVLPARMKTEIGPEAEIRDLPPKRYNVSPASREGVVP